jgi:hypothetical protein
VEEARKALLAYTIRNRKKIRKTKNDRRRLEAVCAEGCPWMLKIAKDSRYKGYTITAYAGNHTCENVWEMRALTANFLKEKFMNEFRDNQKLGLQSFAADLLLTIWPSQLTGVPEINPHHRRRLRPKNLRRQLPFAVASAATGDLGLRPV